MLPVLQNTIFLEADHPELDIDLEHDVDHAADRE